MIGNLPPRHPVLRIFARGIFITVAVILISQAFFAVARADCRAPPVVHLIDVDNGGFGSYGSAVATGRGIYTATHNLEGVTGVATVGGTIITTVTVIAPDVSVIPLIGRTVAPLRRAGVGEPVVVAGYPRGEYHEARGTAEQFYGLLRVAAPGFDLGVSGGGVFDCAGNLLGIVTSITPDRSEVFAHPVALYPYEFVIDTEAAQFGR
jgi:hypothetical protein